MSVQRLAVYRVATETRPFDWVGSPSKYQGTMNDLYRNVFAIGKPVFVAHSSKFFYFSTQANNNMESIIWLVLCSKLGKVQ